MMNRMTSSALALLVGAGLLVGAAPSRAGDPADPPAHAKSKKKAGKSHRTAKFIPGSQETTRERSLRLQRECKGAVNAGACSGYAS